MWIADDDVSTGPRNSFQLAQHDRGDVLVVEHVADGHQRACRYVEVAYVAHVRGDVDCVELRVEARGANGEIVDVVRQHVVCPGEGGGDRNQTGSGGDVDDGPNGDDVRSVEQPPSEGLTAGPD